MKSLLLKCFQVTNGILYNILGSAASSNLAVSPFGKLIFQVLQGSSTEPKVFTGIEGIKVKLTPEEANMLGIFYTGVINPHETSFLQKRLKLGNTFIDVGAYVDGWYTLLAAKLVGNSGKVISFEPVPKYFDRLKENIQLNRYTNVQAEMLGLADKKEIRSFYEAGNISSFYKPNSSQLDSPANRITIRTTTLDNYLASHRIARVDIIKIDVEGAEMEVLKGAKRLLTNKSGPDLIIEVVDLYLGNAGSSRKELMNYLEAFGYKAYTFEESGLLPYKPGSMDYNLFFTKG